ncbi:hypothetical protein EST38_g8832 [Candolleomyces aberdarensis]|uniref:Hydrophobin n=1 Tax=Candolleomyces aberdarensis TaxID=2316362 RepID=A0A4Q2DBN0_9AGAR|nr:hypothetical protein EST38_g8832 [Candolleomyces aberdarensis]
MKFARFFSIAVTTSLSLSATAVPHGGSHSGQCNGGSTVCCNDVQLPEAIDVRVNALLGLLGIKIGGLKGLVGSGCSAINLPILGSGSECSPHQQLCCQNNFYNGLVTVGCTPIDVSL